MQLPKVLQPLVIRGGSFTFRTFADGAFGVGSTPGVERRATLDRLVTVTLPAISGADHTIVPTMEVRLYPRARDLEGEERIGAREARRRKAEETA